MAVSVSDAPQCWPAMRLADWKDTYATLHMWTQIVGKIRLELTPKVNHWWNVPLYLSSRGLNTSMIPYGDRYFDMEFDFFENKLVIRTTEAETASVALAPRTVADFAQEVMAALRSLGIEVQIWKMPVEVADPIPFDRDKVHAAYDAEYVRRLWRILLSVDGVFKMFRARFVGKSSPVHFFWGSFDLAITRFSGRRPGAQRSGSSAAQDHARSVLARSDQRRVVAGKRRDPGGSILLLRSACPPRIR